MNIVSLLTATLMLAAVFPAFGQTPVADKPTPLSQLLAEAETNNPHISAADHGARAARQMATRVTALPDPKFTYQQLSAGSPEAVCGIHQQRFCLHWRRSLPRAAVSGETAGAGRSRRTRCRHETG